MDFAEGSKEICMTGKETGKHYWYVRKDSIKDWEVSMERLYEKNKIEKNNLISEIEELQKER